MVGPRVPQGARRATEDARTHHLNASTGPISVTDRLGDFNPRR
jgi:hypothetical protein